MSYDFLSRKKVLQKLVDNYYLILLDLLKGKLTPFEKELLDLVMSRYVKGSRWYDKYHVPYSALFLLELCEREKLDRSVLIPAILLHDVGYSTLTSGDRAEEVKRGSYDKDIRVAHMQAGVEIATEIFAELRKRGFVHECTVEKAVQDIIATHDNPIIGIALETPLEEQHRDGDMIFWVSFVSFVKDFLRHHEEGMPLAADRLFLCRLAYFSRPEGFDDAYDIGVILPHDIWERYKNRYEPLHHAFSVAVNQKQFRMRLAEIKSGFFDMPLLDFEEACKIYMDKELKFITEDIFEVKKSG